MKARKFLLPGLIGLSLITFIVLLLPRQKEITILLEGQPVQVSTSARTVDDALAEAGFPLMEFDEVSPEAGTRIKDGDTISLTPASQITIWADGQSSSLRTTQRIPAIWLAQANLTLGAADQLWVNGKPALPERPLPFQPKISVELRRAVMITLHNSGQTWVFQSASSNLGQALWDEGFRLTASDILTPSPETPLTTDITANLVPGRQVQITADGQTLNTATSAQTVGETLLQVGLPLQGLDYSIPDAGAPLPDDGLISIIRVHEEVVIEQETIPFEIHNELLPDVEIDNYQVAQIGQVGIRAKRVRIRTENGQEVSQTLEDQWVLREPQDRIEGYGTKIVVRTLDTPDGPIQYWRKVEMLATSYSPCNSDADRCYPGTSLGTIPVQKGVAAVIYDWFIPMGNHTVYVPGYGPAVIADVGAGFPGQHWIDLAYSDEEWVPWYKYVTVYFTTPIPPEHEILYILPYK